MWLSATWLNPSINFPLGGRKVERVEHVALCPSCCCLHWVDSNCTHAPTCTHKYCCWHSNWRLKIEILTCDLMMMSTCWKWSLTYSIYTACSLLFHIAIWLWQDLRWDMHANTHAVQRSSLYHMGTWCQRNRILYDQGDNERTCYTCEFRMKIDAGTDTCSLKPEVWKEFCLFGSLNSVLPLLSHFSTSSSLFLFYLFSAFLTFSHLLWSSLFLKHQFLSFYLSLLWHNVLSHLFLSSPPSWHKPFLSYTHAHIFRGMSGMCPFLQHHVVVTHMTATPEPEECECFSRAHGWMDGWMEA